MRKIFLKICLIFILIFLLGFFLNPLLTKAKAKSSIENIKLQIPFNVPSRWENYKKVDEEVKLIPLKVGERIIYFGVKNNQFLAGENDTWFIYGRFGKLECVGKGLNPSYEIWGGRHNGLDFSARYGLEVVAAASGKVIFTGEFIGKTIIIDHGGFRTTYGHLAKILVKKGQKVKAGQVIGKVGNTGTFNPHLHFELDKLLPNGKFLALNPENYIKIDWNSVIIPDCVPNDPLDQSEFIWSF